MVVNACRRNYNTFCNQDDISAIVVSPPLALKTMGTVEVSYMLECLCL